MTTKHRNTVTHNKALRSSEFNFKENKKKKALQSPQTRNKLKNNTGLLSKLSALYLTPKAKTLLKTTEGHFASIHQKSSHILQAQFHENTSASRHSPLKNYEKTVSTRKKKTSG